MLSSHCLFTRKPSPASELYNRWPLCREVKRCSFLRTSSNPITSHFMLFSFTSSSRYCTCSYFSNALTLYVAIFSRSLHAAGDWRPWLICTLHSGFHDLNFHAGQSGLQGFTEIRVPIIANCVTTLKLSFRPYPAIHNNYIITHCTTLQYNHNI